jgi:hypothetical protein
MGSSSLPAGEIQFKDGDRVALVGSTLIEREQKYGYWELAITTRHPDKNIIFRNLGWSGDTVWGESRVGFDLDNPQKGFERLRDAVLAVKPTVIIVGYGTNESFAGEAGLPRFKEGLNKLLDAFAATNARVVLLAPLVHRSAARGNPALYTEAIKGIARKRGDCFLDLENIRFAFPTTFEPPPMFDKAIHLTEYGYYSYAPAVLHGLGRDLQISAFRVDIASRTTQPKELSLVKCEANAVQFQTTANSLTFIWPYSRKGRPPRIYATSDLPQGPNPADLYESQSWLRVDGLKDGEYLLKIDNKQVASGSAKDWSFGVLITKGPNFDQAEKLRQAIIEKNQLYFHRYRPQNETYLFGFRKYEQGNNAVEVPQFDALIEAKEKEIAKLRVPAKHTYELVPAK